jgi:hypothetical protein
MCWFCKKREGDQAYKVYLTRRDNYVQTGKTVEIPRCKLCRTTHIWAREKKTLYCAILFLVVLAYSLLVAGLYRLFSRTYGAGLEEATPAVALTIVFLTIFGACAFLFWMLEVIGLTTVGLRVLVARRFPDAFDSRSSVKLDSLLCVGQHPAVRRAQDAGYVISPQA